jgi:lipopolysaccharide transport system ATP-binding protein
LSDVVIRAEGLGKKYLIGHEGKRESYVALRDVVARNLKGFVRSAGDVLSGRQLIVGDEVEEFWALKDVGFEVKRGEVLGIIGRNGAGKSTLLKILSRITEPSAGRVEIKGRVASLLEVGTGFHPELTGRENVYLNGAILGMSRAEIKRKFDEIVAFAEVEKFLDTPVKRYSSGMYVRLAFAVAAHLEPEILVVDEVLAVGDAEFQKKCLGKMGEVAGQGRTVLFVSHNMVAIQHLCARALLLKGGRIALDEASQPVISHYLSDAVSSNKIDLESWIDRITTGEARIIALEYDDGRNGTSITFGGNLRIRIRARFPTPARDPVFGFVIHDGTGVPLSDFCSAHDGLHAGVVSGELSIEARVCELSFHPGRYLLSPWICDSAFQRNLDFPKLCAAIEINQAAGEHGDMRLEKAWGTVYFPAHWRLVSGADQ